MRGVPALCLLLFAASFSGCLSGGSGDPRDAPPGPIGPPEIPLASLDKVLPFAAAARDGTALRGHVYLPKGDGPFATILNYSPYWNSASNHSEAQETQAEDGRRTMRGLYGTLLDAGFAVALVNLRGTGESDGCNPWMDLAADGADAHDVIQTLAAEPWSNGNVGMVGISWHGYSQYAALAGQPPALKAVAPASAILDGWTLFTRHGPTINSQYGPMASTYAAFHAQTAVGTKGDTPPSHLDCPEHLAQVRAFHQLTVDGDKSPFFERRDAHAILDANTVPMLVTNGLTRFGEGHILQADGLWDVLPEERRLILGQWPHSYPDDDRADAYREMLVRWFDHYLRSGPKVVETGVVEYQDDALEWHTTGDWPPAHSTARLQLSDGTLVADGDAVSSSARLFQSAYLDPRPDACPANKVLYLSPPLAHDVLLAGNWRANVTVTSTESNGNFGLHLWHVRALLPCQEMPAQAADLYASLEVSRALSDLRHRGHLEQGLGFPVATPDVMAMQSHPFASLVRAGERLVLGASGGAVELAPRAEMPLLTVHTGTGLEGWIDLPVVEGTLAFQS